MTDDQQQAMAELDRLAEQFETAGMDKVRHALGEVFEALFLVARTHPDEQQRPQFAHVFVELWKRVELARMALDGFAGDDDDVVMH